MTKPPTPRETRPLRERAPRTPASDPAELNAAAEAEGSEAAATNAPDPAAPAAGGEPEAPAVTNAPDPAAPAAATDAPAPAAPPAVLDAPAPAATAAGDGSEAADDPEPDSNIVQMKKQRALADANKPIEAATEAVWSTEPDKIKARKAVEDAYRTAARRGTQVETAGELWTRYQKADEKFVNAAADMLRSRHKNWKDDKASESEKFELQESHLWKWIDTLLSPGTPPPASSEKLKVRNILRERMQVESRLINTLGKREKDRQEAVETTKNWEKAFGRWSAPDKEIAALIASYFDRIDQLNADINTGNNRDQAIFSFWFEVAPIHLQLRDEKVAKENTPGVQLIRDALGEFTNLANNYESGKDRNDGSLFLLDPDPKDQGGPTPLAVKRREVLDEWQKAAKRQATAEAAYATRPDAAADLKPRHDKLKDDGWVKGTKEALADPKKP